jgi:hypothetical protein
MNEFQIELNEVLRKRLFHLHFGTDFFTQKLF